jgi:hypothetical protein
MGQDVATTTFTIAASAALALAEYLGVSARRRRQWAAARPGARPAAELSEVTLFTPRRAALTVDAQEAPAVEKARREAERRSVPELALTPDAADWLDGYDVEI